MTNLIARPVVDCSHFQIADRMNWKQAIAAGIVGVIAKACQGDGSIDPAFSDHLYNASEAGIPMLGAYVFLTDSDPTAQASNFLNIVSGEIDGGDLTGILLALDLESNPAGATETISGAADVSDAIFKQISRRPILYMGRFGPSGNGSGLPNATLDLSDIWLPSYGQIPRLPKGFAPPDQLPDQHGGHMRLWQQTDGTMNAGQAVPGLGRVDQSAFVGFDTLDAVRVWWGS